MKAFSRTVLSVSAMLALSGVHAAPLLSADWAAKACASFNSNEILTKELASGWIKNDGGRGYKVVQMYRTDCGVASRVEMRIIPKDGKAICTYGGQVQATALNDDMDYLMHAGTREWREMGAGQYGPMRAMMGGALKFKGPMFEAMSVMGPFEQFLLLPGKVPGTDACPTPG